jgi:hypothetical protein
MKEDSLVNSLLQVAKELEKKEYIKSMFYLFIIFVRVTSN